MMGNKPARKKILKQARGTIRISKKLKNVIKKGGDINEEVDATFSSFHHGSPRFFS
jgi:hypothetical protein